MSIHYADPSSSVRTGAALAALAKAGKRGLTTMELVRAANATSPPANELRAAGWRISCTYERTTEDGRKIYRYRLEGRQ